MSEIHGAVGSYVINALDADELDEFEAHLAVCPTCSREVIEFCETAAELSLLATSSGPPPALRASILTAIQEVRPLPPELPSELPVLAHPRRALVETTAPVDELAVRRDRRRTRILSLAVAAVTVIALSLGGWAFSLVQNQQSQVADSAAQTQLYSAPDVKIYPKTLPDGTQVSFVVSKSLNKAMFVGHDLPALSDAERYQMWTLQGAHPSPDSLTPGGNQTVWFSGSLDGSDALAITVEPKSGSQVPTGAILTSTAI
ncbi:MAG TPA: anti-sigma factor [Propionibacteriaceae bacterium]